MARSMVPSSFECDCGHQSHFCEGTVRDMEADSRRRHKRMLLLDSEAEEHAIEFEGGVATAVILSEAGSPQNHGLVLTRCRNPLAAQLSRSVPANQSLSPAF